MYRFIPAAYSWYHFSGLGAYIKYRNRKGQDIKVLEFTPNLIRLDTPDRELVLVRDAHHVESYRPKDGLYDQYVSFDLLDPDVAADFRLNYVMTNYVYAEKSKHLPRLRSEKSVIGPKKPVIVTDSGGFQIGMQKIGMISPHHLIEHYNQNTDLGMALDIPLNFEYSLSDLKVAAKAQAKNTQVMLKYKRPDLGIINVFHGKNEKEYEIYRRIVEVDEIDRVALGGTQENYLTAAIDCKLDVILIGRPYKQYHVLGVYNTVHMMMLAKLANTSFFKKRSKLLTSDASTPLQSANNKIYHTQQSQTHPARRLRLGDVATYPSVDNILTCQCPVCSAVKYVDVFSVLDNALIRHLLAAHNTWEINRYSLMLDELAATLSPKEYKEVVRSQVHSSENKNAALKTLDFIDDVEQIGVEKARVKSKDLVMRFNHFWSTQSVESSTLFGQVSVEEDQLASASESERREFTLKVLERYKEMDYDDPSLLFKEGKEGKERKKKISKLKKASRFAKAKKLVGKDASKKQRNKANRQLKKAKAQTSSFVIT